MEGGGQRGTSFFCLSAGTKDFLNSYTYDALAQMTDLLQQGQTGGNAVAAKSFYLGHNALGDVTQIDRAYRLRARELHF